MALLLATLLAAVSCDSLTAPSGAGGVPTVRRLLSGEASACALDNAGAVQCWGLSSPYWEYGASPASMPGGYGPAGAAVPALASLARGTGTHSCGISPAGAAVCWARGGSGQLGRGFLEATGNGPAEVVGGHIWVALSVGRLITCGITGDAVGYCWGLDQWGEVGNADTLLGVRVSSPHPLADSLRWRSIAAGWLHACGVTLDGTAYCWGRNDDGQLGIGAADPLAHALTQVAGDLRFARISVGSRYTCGITASGDAYCWGANATGQLGDGTTESRAAPTLVGGGRRFVDIVTGSGFADGAAAPPPAVIGTYGHTCALDTDGRAYCWGWNGSGELGDLSNADHAQPVAVSGGLRFDALAAGGAFTCGMRGAYVWCWGSNLYGQLGAGIADFMAFAPVAVAQPFRAP